jgi:3D (Asp-Asp-Asp) domain-containing protein
MLTRSVVACMLSGTLVSTIPLGGPLTKDVHAKSSAAKKTAKVSRVHKGAQKATVGAARGREAAPPVHPPFRLARHSQTNDNSAVHREPSSLDRTARRPPPTIRLGTFAVRAYTHYHPPGAEPNKTATGTVPVAGRTVAVDPRIIPLGSRIHIEGVGERIAEDTGGKIKGNKLDLFLPSVKDCRQFGVREQEVHLLPK